MVIGTEEVKPRCPRKYDHARDRAEDPITRLPPSSDYQQGRFRFGTEGDLIGILDF